MPNVSTLQSLIGGRWLGAEASVPLHSALNNSLIYHTHAEKIDFEEAVTYARKTGVPSLMAFDFQKRAQCLKALALYLMERKEELYKISHLTGATRPDSCRRWRCSCARSGRAASSSRPAQPSGPRRTRDPKPPRCRVRPRRKGCAARGHVDRLREALV